MLSHFLYYKILREKRPKDQRYKPSIKTKTTTSASIPRDKSCPHISCFCRRNYLLKSKAN